MINLRRKHNTRRRTARKHVPPLHRRPITRSHKAALDHVITIQSAWRAYSIRCKFNIIKSQFPELIILARISTLYD